MSFFSRSSKGNHYKNGNYGGNHYQKKGFLGNIFNVLGSGSNSGNRHNQYPQQNPYQPVQNPYQPQQNPYQPPQYEQPVNQNTLVCGKCNVRLVPGAKFCLECGAKVNEVLACVGCGEKLPPNAKFCLNCGNKVNG